MHGKSESGLLRVQLDLGTGSAERSGWPACHLNISSKYLISYPHLGESLEY